MAKVISLYLVVLLLTAPSIFAYDDDSEGVCGSFSGKYSGACLNGPGCFHLCKDQEAALFGHCEWTSRGAACICYHKC
ncbi:hypothetical protein SUGI_0406300 [Cryptomeria japonica]|nr:hypothetical protein SUGI_0406300 [Cryptomeria japonica]